MKKIFLASSGLGAIKKFVKDEPKNIKMVFVPTAGNLDKDAWWIDKDRDVLKKMGFDLKELDIEFAGRTEMMGALKGADIVYIAGGNTFHLLSKVNSSGFDEMLIDFVDNGGMYSGASAGALIAGIDIGPIASIDEPEKVDDLKSTRGLGFVDFVPIPHYDMNDRTDSIDVIQQEFGDEYKIISFTDDQAIIVAGDIHEIIESPRSSLEMEWFKRANL